MWIFILSVTLLLSYFLEAIIAVPWLLFAIIAISSFENTRTSALTAFFAGILMDIGTARTLGQSSLFFLAISMIIILYRRRFHQESLGFLFGMAFVSVHLYYLLFAGRIWFYLAQAVFGGIITMVVTSILYFIKPKINHTPGVPS